MGKPAAVSHQDALALYLRMPPAQRNLHRLAKEVGVHPTTAKAWSAKFSWQSIVKRYDEDMRASAEDTAKLLAIGDEACMHDRHVQLGRELQRLALEWAKRLAEGEEPRTPGEVVKFAEAGVRIERLAIGAPTARTEVIWNQTVATILELVREMIVPALPEGTRRDILLGDFATAVNATRPPIEGEVTHANS